MDGGAGAATGEAAEVAAAPAGPERCRPGKPARRERRRLSNGKKRSTTLAAPTCAPRRPAHRTAASRTVIGDFGKWALTPVTDVVISLIVIIETDDYYWTHMSSPGPASVDSPDNY